MDESMTMWGRIADTAITALKEQISRLQKERDELAVKLAKNRDIPPEAIWRPLSSPPTSRNLVLITDGKDYGAAGYDPDSEEWDRVAFYTGWQGRAIAWTPLPKLPEATNPFIKDAN